MKKKNSKEMENYFEVFLRNYRNVPGFRSLIQLLLFGLFLLVFMLVIGSANMMNEESKEDVTTTTAPISTEAVTKKAKTYKEILESIYLVDQNYKMEITIGQENYVIEAANIGGDITGYFETSEETKRFKIEENKLYEVKLDSKKENKELFHNIDIDFVIPSSLGVWLSEHRSTKMLQENETIYVYSITKNEIDYEVKAYVKEERVQKIEIINDENSYKINYN